MQLSFNYLMAAESEANDRNAIKYYTKFLNVSTNVTGMSDKKVAKIREAFSFVCACVVEDFEHFDAVYGTVFASDFEQIVAHYLRYLNSVV